jgi:outer membrane protein
LHLTSGNKLPYEFETILTKDNLMKSIFQLVGLSVTLCTFAATAQAEKIKDAIGPGDSDNLWILSANIGTYNNIYAGEGSEDVLYPSVEYNGERFFFKNGSFNYSLGQRQNFTYGLIAAPSSTFLSNEGNYRNHDELAGLVKRDGTIEGGFYINHTTDLGRFRFSLLTDMGSEHDGQRATASYTFDLHAGNWNINPSMGAQWMSGDIVDHYYGVSALESTVTRAGYKGSSAINLFAGVRARYEISDRWDFSASTGFKRLSDNITDSPIVDDDYGYHGNLSMSYKF